MQRDKLLKTFLGVEKKLQRYSIVSGPGLIKKIQRAFIVGFPYIEYIKYRVLKLSFDKEAKLFFDKQILLPVHDVDSHYLLMFGSLGKAESDLTRFLIQHLKNNEIFYDVGANYGFFSLLATNLVSEGEIHLFEPQKELKKYIKKNFSLTNVHKNFFALSSFKGETNLYSRYAAGSSGTSTLQPKALPKESDSNVEIVQVTTLDDYVLSHEPPTMIKLDIEGGETDFLKGSLNVLEKNKPMIIMEVWPGKRGDEFSMKAFHFLIRLGYKAYSIEHDGSLIEYENDIHDSYINLVFQNEERK